MANPFTLGLVKKNEEFCNRVQELTDLLQRAQNGQKIILSSPRRYGKSSLVLKILDQLSSKGFLTAYVDLFPISSENDFLQRLAMALINGIGKKVDPRSFAKKFSDIFTHLRPTLEITPEGYSLSVQYDKLTSHNLLLDDLLEGLHHYVLKKKLKACIVLDEFQEITELAESKKIEGILRSHIQSHREISYFFVGSRRRVLQDMFSNQKRPFYKMAFFYSLKEISLKDFVPYIQQQFQRTGKYCPLEIAEEIYKKVRGYPYYVQKLASLVWDITEKETTRDCLNQSYRQLIEVEKVDFESIWQGLTLVQKGVLKALAIEPTSKPFAHSYITTHSLSLGGLQKALKMLLSLDLVEKLDDELYRLTDPVMISFLLR